MRCKKCKTPLRKGSKFCPKCGAKVKHIGGRVVAAILVLAIVIGGAGFSGWKMGLLPFGKSNAESRQLTVDVLNDFFDVTTDIESMAEGYLDNSGHISLEDAPVLTNVLATEIESCISRGTVKDYSIETSCIWIELSSGIQYTYMLPIDGMSGSGADAHIDVLTYEPFSRWWEEKRPYTDQGKNGELATDEVAIELNIKFGNYYFSENYDDEDVTFDSISHFSDNQVILWDGHGGFSANNHSFIATGETLDKDAFLWDPVYYIQNIGYTEYAGDLLSGKIIVTYVEGERRLSIGSEFIEDHIVSINNSFIYLGACETGKDSVLADAFLNKGAAAVVANSETIATDYTQKMERTICKKMMELNPETNQYYTLREALDYAKTICGDYDVNYGAEVIIYGGKLAEDYRFMELENSAIEQYILAANKTTASGSWTEDMNMTANMVLKNGNSTTKSKATMEASVDIEDWNGTDTSSLYMSGSASMSVLNQTIAYTMTWQNGTAHYDYTEPTITSADVKIDPSYFDFSSITPDMVSASSFLGNTIKFTVREDALTEVGISAVGLMDGIENLSYGDVDVVATVNTDTGKIDTLSMSFHASMTYQGYDAEVDYTIEYRFLDRKAVSSAQILSDDIVDVVLKNESVWVSPFTDYFDESWSAYFMDLDFDGIPEFFVESDMMGSGMYTYRSIYQVEDGRLLELNDPEITESDWDSLTLCKDQQSGEFFFLGEDYIREGVEWYSQSWAKVGVRLGQLTHTMLYSKSQTGDEFNYYGSNREITEDEFYNLQSEFEKNTLNLGSPRGTVIDLWDTQISFEQKRAILLDAYSSVPTGEWVNGFSNTNISDSLS